MEGLRRIRMALLADAVANRRRNVPPWEWGTRILQDQRLRKLYLRHTTKERFVREVRAVIGLVYRM